MKSYLILGLLLTSGCMTIPNTNMKKPEMVTVSIREIPGDKNLRGSFINEAISIGRIIGSFAIREFAKEYNGDYSATVMSTNAIALNDGRKLNKELYLERTVSEKPAAILVVDLVQVPIDNSKIPYFQMRPHSLTFNQSKAKMTNFLKPFLHANCVDLTVDIALMFPDGRQPDGQAIYRHSFVISDLKVGQTRDLSKFMSPVFEIPSDGPMIVDIRLTEKNTMGGFLRTIANWVE